MTTPFINECHDNFVSQSSKKRDFQDFDQMSSSAYIIAGIGSTFNLFRLAADIILCATAKSVNKPISDQVRPTDDEAEEINTVTNSVEFFGSSSSLGPIVPGARSTISTGSRIKHVHFENPIQSHDGGTEFGNPESNSSMVTPLLSSVGTSNMATDDSQITEEQLDDTLDRAQHPSSEELLSSGRYSSLMYERPLHLPFWYITLVLNIIIFVYLVTACLLNSLEVIYFEKAQYDSIPLGAAAVGVFVGIIMQIRDKHQQRFNKLQRVMGSFSALILLVGALIEISVLRKNGRALNNNVDMITLLTLFAFTSLFISDAILLPYPRPLQGVKAGISLKAIASILKPYFWPNATETSSAFLNRVRAFMTWVFVAGSKTCNLISPLLLGRASTALAREDYAECIKYAAIYASLQFTGAFLKECQNLVYLKVSQAAFVQLSEYSFRHLHSLPLEWHLSKKLGEVLRVVDRGIIACDNLMKYLFLWLIPTVAECVLVCIIFIANFGYLPLAISVFYFVFVYIVMTVSLTLWRKKFQKGVTIADNEWHDILAESLVNYETVKIFTSEEYELRRFSNAVQRYQVKSNAVQASLSFLNILQQFMLQSCLACSLILAVIGIRQRSNCCLNQGCESLNSQCCADISYNDCPGLNVGDFVSVLTYILNLFTPLNFLGFIYNIIVMSAVDLTNLSELLAEEPEVTDFRGAIDIPPSSSNGEDPSTVVEFDNVVFHYPTQPETSGLKGLSFKMKKGTTTAIVGSTGAGKTTVSRLLFRFYDVLGGSVKVNGVDLRVATQKSLRQMVGVVPQNTLLFNDTMRSNIAYGNRSASQSDLDRVARDAQIDEFISSLPNGWESPVGDRGLKLSGGEKQRTAIARCLLKNPLIVVLDEATSALDTLTESSVQAALDRLGERRTVLVIAHRLGTIRNADNILVLDDGVVIEEGTHDELLAANGKYFELWQVQASSSTDCNRKQSHAMDKSCFD